MLEALLDEVGDYLITLNVFNWSEPLLHPQLPELIAAARRRGIFTCVSTNLNAGDPPLFHGLVDAELDHLIISISGVDQQTYEQYHRGGKLERVWSNLARLVDYRRRQGKTKPLIELKYLEFGYNRQEARPALAQARQRGADTFMVRHGTIPHQDDAWPGLPSRDWLGRQMVGRACSQLWDTVVLNADGGVAPCCYLYQRADDYDRYLGHGFAATWNNDNFVNARRLFNPGEVDRLAPQLELSCLKCALVHSQAHLRAYLAANRHASVEHLTGWRQGEA